MDSDVFEVTRGKPPFLVKEIRQTFQFLDDQRTDASGTMVESLRSFLLSLGSSWWWHPVPYPLQYAADALTQREPVRFGEAVALFVAEARLAEMIQSSDSWSTMCDTLRRAGATHVDRLEDETYSMVRDLRFDDVHRILKPWFHTTPTFFSRYVLMPCWNQIEILAKRNGLEPFPPMTWALLRGIVFCRVEGLEDVPETPAGVLPYLERLYSEGQISEQTLEELFYLKEGIKSCP